MKNQQKKPYVKPEVTEVALRAEEAVLGNCKSASTSGPGSMPGQNCGTMFCSTIGS